MIVVSSSLLIYTLSKLRVERNNDSDDDNDGNSDIIRNINNNFWIDEVTAMKQCYLILSNKVDSQVWGLQIIEACVGYLSKQNYSAGIVFFGMPVKIERWVLY